MNMLNEKPTLKEIHAFKKKICWGDLPTIFHMAYNSVSDVDNILTHGFDSSYKQLFNINNWNLTFLGSHKDDKGNLIINSRPQIALQHVFNEQHYELHCYPILNGEKTNLQMLKNPHSPFINWLPESMQILFRISSFVSFMTYHAQGGDEADVALIKFTHLKVENLIEKLKKTFDVTETSGRSISDFYHEIQQRKSNII
ncbi:MAG: hypothetical protein JKX78_09355 [Alteromonadaceae bacterium]|nr:hypothetical protein [Alteromonadaceae bacterium]